MDAGLYLIRLDCRKQLPLSTRIIKLEPIKSLDAGGKSREDVETGRALSMLASVQSSFKQSMPGKASASF